MSMVKQSNKQMHTNIENFEIEAQEGDKNALTSDDHAIRNSSEHGQVCVYQ
jgi:hypothetical protein